MTVEDWKYFENTFEIVTRKSWVLMDRIVADHLPKLLRAADATGANPLLIGLRAPFVATAATWSEAFSTWQTDTADYRGATATLETRLRELSVKPGPEESSKIEEWETRARTAAPRGSGIYRALFPRGREPFSGGKRDDIIQAVKTLGEQLAKQTAKPALVTLGLEVTAFHAVIYGARQTQQANEGAETAAARAIEPVRLTTAEELYGNLGMLMHLNRKNPAAIAGFFDLGLIREPSAASSVSGSGSGVSPTEA